MITEVASRRGAKVVRANGIDIAYTEVGDGPPLVLLSGAMSSTGPRWAGRSAAWVDHFDALGRHFRVIAPDTRGAGATVHPSGAATFDVLTADVVELIGMLGLDRPFVAGFSEGGATATLVALHHPDIVRAVVNHGGLDYFDPETISHQSLRPIFGGSPDATRADPDAAERTIKGMSPEMATTFATMKADFDEAQGDGHWRTYLGQFFDRHVAPFGHLVDDLAALSVPCLLMAGDRDFFVTPETACRAYRTIEHAELAIMPATDHAITGAVAAALSDFLCRHEV